jgi:hypothetical protein
MIILTSSASGTHKAQIRSSPERGFKQLYTATSTESERSAARRVVEKTFGPAAAQSVRQVKESDHIRQATGNFFNDPKRKQVFNVWTFIP